MRIGIDARPLSGPIDGIGRYTREVVSRLLLQEQHEWFLYSHGPINVDNVELANIRHPKSSTAISNIQSLFNLGYWANKDKVDVFWSPRHHLPIWQVRACKVTTIHDLCWRELPTSMPWQRRLREQALFTASVKRSDRLITVSNTTANALKKHNQIAKKNIVVTPLASSFKSTRQTDTAGNRETEQSMTAPYLLFVGTIEPRKNLELLLNAFRQMKDQVPHRLVIAGRQGWGNLNLQTYLDSNSGVDRILWIKDASDLQLEQLYRNADLLVSLSHYEGFGLYALEAMSLGTPTCLSDIEAHREVAGTAARYIKADSVTAVASAITQLIKNSEHLELCRSRGLERAAEFSWDITATKTLATLESCGASA